MFRFLFRLLVPMVFFVLIGAGGALFLIRDHMRTHYAAVSGLPPATSVDVAEFVEIGGARQWLRIRGRDRDNPVLLVVQGGPLRATSGLAYAYQQPWEDFFTVVQWDQRGVGKSIIDEVAVAGHLSQEQLLADAIEMAEHLTTRFAQERIFVMGESFGSLVALQLAAERPDLLHAYVGVGQMVAWQASLNETRRLAMAGARERGDEAELAALEALGPLPDPHDTQAYFDWYAAVLGNAARHGSFWRGQEDFGATTMRVMTMLAMSPDIELADLPATMGYGVTGEFRRMLLPEIHDLDLRATLPARIDVPVVLLHGSHDWIAPVALAKSFFDELDAPYKQFVELPDQAHIATLANSGAILVTLATEVRTLAHRRYASRH